MEPVNLGRACKSHEFFFYFFVWSSYFYFIVCVILFSNFRDNSKDFIKTATFTESYVLYNEVVRCNLVMEQN